MPDRASPMWSRTLQASLIALAIVLVIAALTRIGGGLRSGVADPPVSGFEPCPTPAGSRFLTAEMIRYPCSTGGVRWKLLSSVSAHRAMVIRIEIRDPADADRVASHLVEGERDRFDEVLVYVLRTEDPEPVLTRRIQWTVRGGYASRDYPAQ